MTNLTELTNQEFSQLAPEELTQLKASAYELARDLMFETFPTALQEAVKNAPSYQSASEKALEVLKKHTVDNSFYQTAMTTDLLTGAHKTLTSKEVMSCAMLDSFVKSLGRDNKNMDVILPALKMLIGNIKIDVFPYENIAREDITSERLFDFHLSSLFLISMRHAREEDKLEIVKLMAEKNIISELCFRERIRSDRDEPHSDYQQSDHGVIFQKMHHGGSSICGNVVDSIVDLLDKKYHVEALKAIHEAEKNPHNLVVNFDRRHWML